MDLWQDIRFGAWLLVKARWFTLAAGTAVALGIGANTTVFTKAVNKRSPDGSTNPLSAQHFERIDPGRSSHRHKCRNEGNSTQQ